jgi:hypothetical protein
MSEKLSNLYEIALQEDEGEDSPALSFKLKYKLESGFYKKPIEFFYWLYQKENGKLPEKEFRKSFIGRMVKFDKKNIPNYPELVFEYEKEKFLKKTRNIHSKKSKLKRLSKATKSKNDAS